MANETTDMDERQWLCERDQEWLADYAQQRGRPEITLLLADFAAAKVLLGECAGYVRCWSEQPTHGDVHVENVVAGLRKLLRRIHAIPGIIER